jgi:hypothetical protein
LQVGNIVLSPKFLPSLDLSRGEEADSGEAQVLVLNEHFDWDQVGLTQMVDEARNVAVLASV